MRKILSILLFSTMVFFASCDGDDDKDDQVTPTGPTTTTTTSEGGEKIDGSYLVKNVKIGDLIVLDLTYNTDNQITKSLQYITSKGEVLLKDKTINQYESKKIKSKSTKSYYYDYSYYNDEYELEETEETGKIYSYKDKEDLPYKVQEWVDQENNITSYVKNTIEGGKIVKSENYLEDDGEFEKQALEYRYKYNGDLITETIIFDAEEDEVFAKSKVLYDAKNNPTQYQFLDTEENDFTDLARVEYYQKRPNYFGKAADYVFDGVELGEIHNAPKSAYVNDSPVAADVVYSDFNDGGYPTKMEFKFIDETGQVIMYRYKIEYIKKK